MFSCHREGKRPWIERSTADLHLQGDSGYITHAKGIPFLVFNQLTESAKWQYSRPADTMGKYYKLPNSNYMVCMFDVTYGYTTHLMMEITSASKLVAQERFFHGNNCNCWLNFEFQEEEHGYFSLITCGTGSAYSARYLWLFKNVILQDSTNSILQTLWVGSCAGREDIWSDMEWKGDSLLMHYIDLNYYCDAKDNEVVSDSIVRTVTYSRQGNYWVTNDKEMDDRNGPP